MILGKSLDIEPDMLRIEGRHIHRGIASASTPYDYHLRNMCLPFLDHLTEGLNTVKPSGKLLFLFSQIRHQEVKRLSLLKQKKIFLMIKKCAKFLITSFQKLSQT